MGTHLTNMYINIYAEILFVGEFLYSISVFFLLDLRGLLQKKCLEQSGTPEEIFLLLSSTSAAYAGGGSYKKDKQLHTMCFMSL